MSSTPKVCPSQEEMFEDAKIFFSNPMVITPLVLFFSTLLFVVAFRNKGEKEKLNTLEAFSRELGGSTLMICLCFSAGPYLGHLSGYEEWFAHGAGILTADFLSGGSHQNPAMSFAMFLFREISLEQLVVRVAGQMTAGILAFPMLQTLSLRYGVTIGGPGFDMSSTEEAMVDEAAGTFILVCTVATLCMTWFGAHYFKRMVLIAATIRTICIYFPKAGPSLNPMLGTTWAFYNNGYSWPTNIEHYLVYWVAPCIGAAASVCLFTIVWAVVSGPVLTKSDRIRITWEKLYTALTKERASDEEILAFFTPTSQLVICSGGACSVLKRSDMGFLKHFRSMKKCASNIPITVVEGDSVFLKWIQQDVSGTDTVMFDEGLKIIRQHTTIFK